MKPEAPFPSGWFPDPHGRYDHRWFNGTAWTADVAQDGQRFVDPDGAAPVGFRANPAQPTATRNGMAVAALTCGLIGLALAWFPYAFVVGLVLAVLAVLFGVRGIRAARTKDRGQAMSVIGLIGGAVAIPVAWFGFVMTREFHAYLFPGDVRTSDVQCTVQASEIVVTGTLHNDGGSAHDYTLFGVLERPSSIGDLVATLDDVSPGTPTEFTMRRTVSEPPNTCSARVVVHGPFPFDTEVQRVRD